jgi:hypothetical protein
MDVAGSGARGDEERRGGGKHEVGLVGLGEEQEG